jgi:hypothetical protein
MVGTLSLCPPFGPCALRTDLLAVQVQILCVRATNLRDGQIT